MWLTNFIRSLVIFVTVLAGSGLVNAQVKWDLASANPPTNFQTISLDKFIADIDAQTKGALKITHHSNASLYKMAEIKRATQRGQVAIGEVLMGTLANEFPLLGFDSVPFLLSSRAEANAFWNAIKPVVEKRLAEQGLTLLFVQPWPSQGLYSTKELKMASDLKGTRFRAHSPIFAKYAQAVGAQPLSIPYTELSQAIFTGGVDTMMTGISAAADLKFWKSMPYYYDVKASFTHNIVFANTEKFNALPVSLRNEVMKIAAASQERSIMSVEQLEQSQINFVVENGMKVQPPSSELISGLRASGKGIVDDWIEQVGPDARNALAIVHRR